MTTCRLVACHTCGIRFHASYFHTCKGGMSLFSFARDGTVGDQVGAEHRDQQDQMEPLELLELWGDADHAGS